MIVIENMQGTGRRVEARKLVVKLGSSVIAGEGSEPDFKALGAIADDIVALRARGVEVIVVSSGAIGMARRQFPGFKARTIPDRQALAAIGQVTLMKTWRELFEARGFKAAQVLLTRDDLENRQRYLNANHTLERLLALGAVPVINENDTVTIDELRFGDNDQLSALIAAKINADVLAILSVVDGVLEKGSGRRLGPTVPVLDCHEARFGAMADASTSQLGTGGMASKLEAARIASLAGLHTVIANGKRPGVLCAAMSGAFAGTYIPPGGAGRLSGRERWLAFGQRAHGRRLIIDAGAADALTRRHKSLLPAGVKRVEGTFAKGDVIEVLDEAGRRVAKGLVNFDSAEMTRICGKKTAQVREILGETAYDEAVHRNNMFIFE